jgi:hypothetical protein
LNITSQFSLITLFIVSPAEETRHRNEYMSLLCTKN